MSVSVMKNFVFEILRKYLAKNFAVLAMFEDELRT